MNKEQMDKKIAELKSVKGFQEAYNRVKQNKEITTRDIHFFNISLESFLRYAQLPDAKCKEMIEKLLIMFE